MSIFGMWGEARGAVLRKEYEDASARLQDADLTKYCCHNG
jgi:hypothetical protein